MELRGLHNIKQNGENLGMDSKSRWTQTTKYMEPKNQSFSWLYEGQIVNDKNHGYGILTKVNAKKIGKKRYAGFWENNKMEGFGRYWYDNGNYYEGSFHNDERSGFGRMWYSNGNFYQGSWRNNLYDGSGMFIYANGNRYEGGFLSGKKSGHGTYYHLKTGQLQKGDWISDICIRSNISDMRNRQSACEPSRYPIPILVWNI